MYWEAGMDAISLISAWNNIVLQLSYIFTEPTARIWQQIVLGWILKRGPTTVTGIFRTLGNLANKHWTVYQKFFYRAAWSLEELSIAVLVHVIYPMIVESGVLDEVAGKPVADMAIDDTTVGRCGKHVAHAGWFRDASTSASSHKGTVIHWAHNWLVGAITVRLPRWPMIRWVLPVIFALYRKQSDCKTEDIFRTRQELAGEMIQTTAEALPEVQLRVSTDGQYAKRQVVQALPEGVNLVSRIRRDAAIYQLPPKRRRKGKRGRKPKKGKRLPCPRKMAAYRKKGWEKITVYKQGYQVQRLVLGITCLWYHVCRDVPIRMVIVRDPSGKEKDDFFFCTDARVADEEIVQRYYDRWGVEECILEAKQHMGFESTQGWCSKTVNRQAPLAMLLVTLVKAWYARCAADEPSLLPETMPWYAHKRHPSFVDMLSGLRKVLWQHRISPNLRFLQRVKELIETVSYGLFAA
jgi:SRSO17 transposase